MKKQLLTCLIILTGTIITSGNSVNTTKFITPFELKTDDDKKNDKPNSAGTKNIKHTDLNNQGKLLPPSPSTIDVYDTVVFDISQAVIAGSYVEFPVYILSDDFVYSLDFSLKFNYNDFVYDTIIDLTTYLMDYSYLNPNDTIIRFTSSTLTPIVNNTPLVKIRFDTLAGPMCSGDLNTLTGRLNGDACSVKVIDCVLLGISENNMNDNLFTVYPNPSSGIININFNASAREDYRMIVTDITGKIVYENKFVSSFGINQVSADLQNLSKGIYQLRVISSSASYCLKFVLQ